MARGGRPDLELWTGRHPKEHRVEDVVEYCREMLAVYGDDGERGRYAEQAAAAVEDQGEGGGSVSGLSEVLAPVLASRYPGKPLPEIAAIIERLEAIGLDETAVRYQVERGLISREVAEP